MEPNISQITLFGFDWPLDHGRFVTGNYSISANNSLFSLLFQGPADPRSAPAHLSPGTYEYGRAGTVPGSGRERGRPASGSEGRRFI